MAPAALAPTALPASPTAARLATVAAAHPVRWDQQAARRRRSVWREAAASAVAGSVHAVIEQPIATPIEAAITQTQVNGLGFVDNFMTLFRQNALYRSLPTALAGAVPKAVVHYSILNCCINAMAPDGDMTKADNRTAALIGMATGATEVYFVAPLNFVKFRMQRPEWGYTGMVDAVKTIYRVEGLQAFWKGAGAIVLRNMICNGGMVGGYKYTEKALAESGLDIPDVPRHLLAGAVGGVVGSFVSYPFEMLRAAKTHNISFMEEIVAKGPQRILAGWAPGAARLVITAAIMGSIIPHLKAFGNALVMEGEGGEV